MAEEEKNRRKQNVAADDENDKGGAFDWMERKTASCPRPAFAHTQKPRLSTEGTQIKREKRRGRRDCGFVVSTATVAARACASRAPRGSREGSARRRPWWAEERTREDEGVGPEEVAEAD